MKDSILYFLVMMCFWRKITIADFLKDKHWQY